MTEAPEMVERVAEAIHDHWQNGQRTWDETCKKLPGAADDFRAKARVAIEAIRNPTKKMRNAGAFHCIAHAGPAGDHELNQAARIWGAMIDEATR